MTARQRSALRHHGYEADWLHVHDTSTGSVFGRYNHGPDDKAGAVIPRKANIYLALLAFLARNVTRAFDCGNFLDASSKALIIQPNNHSFFGTCPAIRLHMQNPKKKTQRSSNDV